MSSFADRNLIPRAPAGASIPQGARQAILASIWHGLSISTSVVWETFIHREALGTWGEIDDELRGRVGDDAANEFRAKIAEHHARDRQRMVGAAGVNYDAEPALLALPSPYFLTAVEYALSLNQYGGTPPVVIEINKLLTKVGASYRFDYAGQADWHGDTGVHDAVVRPALDALADPRLTGCASEYHAALNHMRGGTEKDLEDVIEESGKAVESAMKVVLQQHGVALTGKETAFPLFQLLVDRGVCPPEADNAVLGVARIRNGVPELAVNSAPTAIKYLSELLP